MGAGTHFWTVKVSHMLQDLVQCNKLERAEWEEAQTVYAVARPSQLQQMFVFVVVRDGTPF